MDNLVKGVQCYELFGGIALKNHTFFLTLLIFFLYKGALDHQYLLYDYISIL